MKIRNFSIVAHIDHGKTTLSDRILEDTGTVPKRKMQAQLLDGMDLERERGITIKAKAVRILYKDYILNLIDTPGHVDFSYEVARSLRACEGVLLLVDASQGVEAQTVAHAHLAQSLGLKIIPVMNKVDLSQSDADTSEEQLWDILKEPIEAERVSAKTGMGIEHLLDRIITDIPAPQGDPNDPLRALIFDSYYDPFRGVIMYVRIVDGTVKPGQIIKFMSSGTTYKIEELGYMTPKQLHKDKELSAGEVGYLVAGIKDIHQVNSLWRRMIWKCGNDGFDFQSVRLGGIEPELYSVYQAAKAIAVGCCNITLAGLASPELVTDEAFHLITGALLMAKYGDVVLNLKKGVDET